MQTIETTPFNLLLIERDPEISKMLSFSLETQFGISVIATTDPEAAEGFLGKTAHIQLVLFGEADECLDLVRNFGDGRHPDLKIILGLAGKLSDPSLLLIRGILGIAARASLVEDTVKLIQDQFFHNQVLTTPENTEFCKVKPDLLLHVNPLVSDVYLRLSDEKYLRVFKQGDSFETADFEKYSSQRHVDYLFVKRSEFGEFLKRFNSKIADLLSSPAATIEEVSTVSQQLLASVQSLVNTLGVTDEVRNMTKTNTALVLKTIEKTPHLSDVVARFQKEKGTYIVSHSLALAEISCILSSQVSWLSDFTFQKLILASFFHDITLKDN